MKPSPSYPGKQVQVKEPSVLVHEANTSHGRYLHSFSSVGMEENIRTEEMKEFLRGHPSDYTGQLP